MRNTKIILLIVSVGVLGLLLYLQTAALRKQRRYVQELNAKLESMSKTASLNLQEKCAKQAHEQFVNLGWGKHESAVFGNHYNQKLNKCFLQIENTDGEMTWKTVSDAFEGKVYAQYA